MQPMAIPSVGGMAVSLVTLFIVPCVYSLVEEWKLKRRLRNGERKLASPPAAS
jgi:Cu(I)/Ag(I) efflux system membrane protein CusA/SilA